MSLLTMPSLLSFLTKSNKRFRAIFWNFIYGTHFKAVGKNVTFQIDGKFSTRANAIIDHNTVIIVERGASLTLGQDVYIGPGVTLKCYGGNISLGNRSSLNACCFLNGSGDIIIEDDVRVGAHTSIIAGSHSFSDATKPLALQGTHSKGIKVKRDVWIGTGVRILDGVTIESRIIVGAGAVANKSLSVSGIYGGVPIKFLRHYTEAETTKSNSTPGESQDND